MAARTPENTEVTEEQSPEQAIAVSEASEAPGEPHTEPSATESDPTSRRRLPRKRVLIPVIAAVAVMVLAVAGWLVYTNIKHANELAAAKQAYETSLNELSGAQDAANTANADLSAASVTLSAHIDVAEQLVTQIGDGSDILNTAGEVTVDAKAVLDTAGQTAPKKSAGELPENPAIADYDGLQTEVDKLVATVKAYTKALDEQIAAFTKSNTELTAAWQTQTDTVPDAAAAAIAANPNASQETKDAVTAAAEALVALDNPLAPEAVELWQTLKNTSETVVSEEAAYQAQKAAEEEAARQGARNSGGGGGGNPGAGGGNPGGSSCQSASCYTGPSSEELAAQYMAQFIASLAANLGVPASSITCYDNTPNSTRCDYPGGWREFFVY